jgi:DNA-binding NarL/FixJ family response regulator
MSVRVLLADDQPLIRAGFRMLLEEQPDISVIGEAADGTEAVRLTRQLRPDVVLMDVRMPGTDGLEATRSIVDETPESRVLVLTTYDLDEYAFTALRYGASGFLLKDARPADLADAIRAVADGDAIIAPGVTRRLLDNFASLLPDPRGNEAPGTPALDQLTSRERQVLIHVAEGLTNSEIAAAMFLSEATVKSHLGRVLAKLDLRDRVQAVILGYEAGLVHPRRP